MFLFTMLYNWTSVLVDIMVTIVLTIGLYRQRTGFDTKADTAVTKVGFSARKSLLCGGVTDLRVCYSVDASSFRNGIHDSHLDARFCSDLHSHLTDSLVSGIQWSMSSATDSADHHISRNAFLALAFPMSSIYVFSMLYTLDRLNSVRDLMAVHDLSTPTGADAEAARVMVLPVLPRIRSQVSESDMVQLSYRDMLGGTQPYPTPSGEGSSSESLGFKISQNENKSV